MFKQGQPLPRSEHHTLLLWGYTLTPRSTTVTKTKIQPLWLKKHTSALQPQAMTLGPAEEPYGPQISPAPTTSYFPAYMAQLLQLWPLEGLHKPHSLPLTTNSRLAFSIAFLHFIIYIHAQIPNLVNLISTCITLQTKLPSLYNTCGESWWPYYII
jgi:hypothetical protein